MQRQQSKGVYKAPEVNWTELATVSSV